MHDPLPWEVLLGQLADGGFHYQLPHRQLGRLRFLGLFLILIGLAGGGLLLLALVHAGWPWLAAQLGWTSWLLVPVLAVAVLAAGRSLVRLGLFIFWGHSQVHLRQGQLSTLEIAALSLRRRSQPFEAIRRLTVTRIPLTRLAVIRADCDGGKRLWLFPGYPIRFLAPLARDIARRCAKLASVADIPVTLAESLPEQPVFDARAVVQERREPPTDSRVRVEERDDGVTVRVLPVGVWRGSRGLFAFGLAWCAVLALLTVGAVQFADVALAGNWGVFAALLGCCWAISLFMLLLAVARGRRQVVFTVVADTLKVAQLGLFRNDHRQWPREDVLGVTVGPSFVKVHDMPLLELKLWEFPGSFINLLIGHDPAELAYLATRLRHALDLPLELDFAPRYFDVLPEPAEEPVEVPLRQAS